MIVLTWKKVEFQGSSAYLLNDKNELWTFGRNNVGQLGCGITTFADGSVETGTMQRAVKNNGDPVYWITDSSGTVQTDSDGNNIVGVPLFDPVLAFPLVTDEVGSDIRWLSARFEQEDGNGSFNLDGHWDYAMTGS